MGEGLGRPLRHARHAATLDHTDLERTVTIRGTPMLVHEALLRSLAHISYHVGQIVYQAKALAGEQWRYLSIPPGHSDAYNEAPKFERAGDHIKAMRERPQRS